jgi:signal peptidase I
LALALALAPVAAAGALLLWGPDLLPGWGRQAETLARLALALFLLPAAGHVLRRLNDLGWQGWWAWGLLLPGVNVALLLLLVTLPRSGRQPRPGGWRALGYPLALAAALAVAASALWTTAGVLAQTMKPGLLPGDLLLVRRAPLRLERGDIVVLRLPGAAEARVARLIGLPGERVAVAGGAAVIDGRRAALAAEGFHHEPFAPQGPLGLWPLCGNGAVGLGADCRTRRLREELPGGGAHHLLDLGPRPLDDWPGGLVPPAHAVLLHDHRDAGGDSRQAPAAGGLGLVPLGAILGRAELVLASADGPAWNPLAWRPGRLFERVR